MDHPSPPILSLPSIGTSVVNEIAYRQIKMSARQAVRMLGGDWAKRRPVTQQGLELRGRMRDFVLSQVPQGHSNKSMVWRRYWLYALEYAGEIGFASKHQ